MARLVYPPPANAPCMEQIGFDDNIGDIMDSLAVHDDLKAKLSRIKK